MRRGSVIASALALCTCVPFPRAAEPSDPCVQVSCGVRESCVVNDGEARCRCVADSVRCDGVCVHIDAPCDGTVVVDPDPIEDEPDPSCSYPEASCGAETCAVQLLESPEHCGRCDHFCLGGGCLSGACQAFEVDFGPYTRGLALFDGAAYSFKNGSLFSDPYELRRCPIGGPCSEPNIATASFVVAESLIAVEAGLLFKSRDADGAEAIQRVRLDAGGPPSFSTLVEATVNITPVALVDGRLFWREGRVLYRAPVPPSGAVSPLDTVELADVGLGQIAVSGGSVWVADAAGLRRIDVVTGEVTTVTSASFLSAAPISVVGEAAYAVLDDGVEAAIARVTSGGDVEALVPLTASWDVHALHADEEALYWVDSSDLGAIRRTPLAGGPNVLLYSGDVDADEVAFDARAVVWRDASNWSALSVAK